MPILPFIIIGGSIGWIEFSGKGSFSKRTKRILHGCWVFFWVINFIALVTITPVYSKKARVETMVYLSNYKNINYLLVADAGNNPELFPCFYSGQWPHIYDELFGNETNDSLLIRASKATFQKQPRFILISTEINLHQEVLKVRRSFPFIVYETTIEPGFIDKLVRWLNPVNKNRTVYIYRNTLFYQKKAEK